MAIDLTAEFTPIFWGLVALLLVCAGAILAGLDPELTEVQMRNPHWWLASIAIAIIALVTIATLRPELTHGLRAILAAGSGGEILTAPL